MRNDKMKILEIGGTNTTPYVEFRPDGLLLIEGRCIPIDGLGFFEPLLEWIDEYMKLPARSTTLTVNFEYANELTSKLIFQTISRLKTACPDFTVEWRFEEGDEDMLDLGEILTSLSGCKFVFAEVCPV